MGRQHWKWKADSRSDPQGLHSLRPLILGSQGSDRRGDPSLPFLGKDSRGPSLWAFGRVKGLPTMGMDPSSSQRFKGGRGPMEV